MQNEECRIYPSVRLIEVECGPRWVLRLEVNDVVFEIFKAVEQRAWWRRDFG
jgi:hypothetical protein